MTDSEKQANVNLVVVGSIGLDDIETPWAKRERLLGGSVSYACAAASFLSRTGMVGVVGDDFPSEYVEQYRSFGIDVDGLQCARGKTFRWSGSYHDDMINRETLLTELNVFADFSPRLPASYRNAPYVLLGNISPELQLTVLDQVQAPRFVAADTMDLWINTARDPLMQVIQRVDMLMLNDSEARLLTDEHNLKRCGRMILDMGPRYVIIKKGEHGGMMMSKDGIGLIPAFPVDAVTDPTGAGDAFAGGFMGVLAHRGVEDDAAVRQGMIYGSVVASFGVEAFSLDRLRSLDRAQIESRLSDFRRMMHFGEQ